MATDGMFFVGSPVRGEPLLANTVPLSPRALAEMVSSTPSSCKNVRCFSVKAARSSGGHVSQGGRVAASAAAATSRIAAGDDFGDQRGQLLIGVAGGQRGGGEGKIERPDRLGQSTILPFSLPFYFSMSAGVCTMA